MVGGKSRTKLIPEQWLLLSLSCAKDGRFSPIQAQKTMFLLEMEAKGFVGDEFYKFKPYLYGPYSPAIASDLEKLKQNGQVDTGTPTPFQRASYLITPQGSREASSLSESVDPRMMQFVRRTVDWVKAQTFTSLLGEIYKKYPDYATQSIFKR
jgi:uncharacterized protein YwgA